MKMINFLIWTGPRLRPWAPKLVFCIRKLLQFNDFVSDRSPTPAVRSETYIFLSFFVFQFIVLSFRSGPRQWWCEWNEIHMHVYYQPFTNTFPRAMVSICTLQVACVLWNGWAGRNERDTMHDSSTWTWPILISWSQEIDPIKQIRDVHLNPKKLLDVHFNENFLDAHFNPDILGRPFQSNGVHFSHKFWASI